MEKLNEIQQEVKEETKKTNYGRKSLTEQQEQYCQLVVKGSKPLEAMLEVYPGRKKYVKGNQTMLCNKLQSNPRIISRLQELFKELRSNEVVGDLYNFEKGVSLLNKEIQLANQKIEEGYFSEAIHRVILSSVQELNRMYGFNVVDKNGNTGNAVNITFVNVKKPEEVER